VLAVNISDSIAASDAASGPLAPASSTSVWVQRIESYFCGNVTDMVSSVLTLVPRWD
jgi:hypothetical protein